MLRERATGPKLRLPSVNSQPQKARQVQNSIQDDIKNNDQQLPKVKQVAGAPLKEPNNETPAVKLVKTEEVPPLPPPAQNPLDGRTFWRMSKYRYPLPAPLPSFDILHFCCDIRYSAPSAPLPFLRAMLFCAGT